MITREEAIRKLFKLKDCYDLDITEMLDILNKSDGVPEKIIEFINTYDYNIETFFEHLKNKQFYKAIKSSTNEYEMIKGLSSLLTHIIIEIEKYPERKSLISESLLVDEILSSLYSYFLKNTTADIKSLTEKIQNLLKEGEK